MKTKKGFTLVELLAVIAILAILVIIALPNVINLYTKAQKETFLAETKKIYTESEKKFISDSVNNKKTRLINSENNTKLDMTGEKLQYCVILGSNGKVTSMKASNGKWIASLDNGKVVDDLSIDDLEEGNLDNYKCSSNGVSSPEAIYCTFGGDMVQGAEYVNGQYTYRYRYEGSSLGGWKPIISYDGWGVILTDKDSTEPVISKICTYINDKPIVSMSYMYYESKATAIDTSSFDTSNIVHMNGLFDNTQVEQLDLSNFDTSKVADMSYMFSNSRVTTPDLSNFDTSKVVDMSYMFRESQATALDLSNFDTSKVRDMRYMFNSSQATKLDLSNFNTSKVTDMSYMFSKSNATDIDVSKFDTSNVEKMSHMFRNTKVTELDLSSFDTSKVIHTDYMFASCSNLKTIYASDKFVTDIVTKSNVMFSSSKKLVGGAGTVYDPNNINKTYARIDGGTSSPGYFTLKN